MRNWAFLILCCIFSCFTASGVYGTIFIVTSKADSGPGTLRQAILDAAANGIATPDVIRFNIPQTLFTQHFIDLVTPLPPLSSYLEIDGTTQPGNQFAITDAKICIRKLDYAPDFTLFTLDNVSDIKIYGLYLYYGYADGILLPPYRSQDLFAIKLSNAFNIEIGAPGKGNVINGYNYSIYSNSDSCRNIRIQSNYIGIGQYYADVTLDVDTQLPPTTAAIEMLNAKDVLIGGPTPAEGNMITGTRAVHLDSRYATGNGFIHIENNIFGKYYDRIRILGGQDDYLSNLFIGDNEQYFGLSPRPAMDYEVSILNNDIPTSLGIEDLSTKFTIRGNLFEFPANGISQTNMAAKLIITDCSDGEVGGPFVTDANIFRNGGLYGITAISANNNGPVKITLNVFECNTILGGSPITINTNKTAEPFVRIDQTSGSQVSGVATPNCLIELFYDDDCPGCEGKVWIASTNSDAQGNWAWAGTILKTVVATATTGNGTTSEFSVPETDISNVVIKQPSCGQRNGSITGLVVRGGDSYEWRDVLGNVIGTSIDLRNVGPGQYIFYGKLGNTCIQFGAFYNLTENTTRIADTTSKTIIHPDCGRNNGSINNIPLFLGTNAVIEWQNDRGQIIAPEMNGPYVSVTNLYPGKYRLYIRDTAGGGCNDSTFFYELRNLGGPSVDTNGITISPATCGNGNGSITNLRLQQLNNTPFIQWLDSAANPVGNTIDLFNVPPGRYRLKFKDASACDTVITIFFNVPGTNLAIDITQLQITQSRCNQNNGSITGLRAPGATGYRWLDASGNNVGNTVDLVNVGIGNYKLEAFDINSNCTIQSAVYTVGSETNAPIDATAATVTPASCNLDNASIAITNITNNPAYFSFNWLLDSTSTVGTGLQINNLAPGRYQCIVTDTNGCSKQIYAATISRLPMPVIEVTGLKIIPDTCQRLVGSITGLNIVNGVAFKWLDASLKEVGQQKELRNIGEGGYQLSVTGDGQCTITSQTFTVTNLSVPLPPPLYDNYTIPKGTALKMQPVVRVRGTYKIYETQVGGSPLQQNATGVFDVTNLTQDITYYIEIQEGNCSSQRVPVEVKVVDEVRIYAPNAFSPNGDAYNQTWTVKVVGLAKLNYLRVFNRWGQVVFETTDPLRRWDGTFKGNTLPVGSYYWVLSGVDIYGKTISQKGPVLIVR